MGVEASRVYTPGKVTVGWAALLLKPCGPLHSKVLPAGMLELSVRAGCAQVRVPPPALTCGMEASAATVAVAVAVQPLGAVTVAT